MCGLRAHQADGSLLPPPCTFPPCHAAVILLSCTDTWGGQSTGLLQPSPRRAEECQSQTGKYLAVPPFLPSCPKVLRTYTRYAYYKKEGLLVDELDDFGGRRMSGQIFACEMDIV